MRKLIPLAVAAIAAATGVSQAAAKASPEVRLERALEGRVAGAPVDCINLRNVRSSQIIDRTAIVYDAGSTVYVNHPRGGAQSLDGWDTLVTKTHSSQLCSIDIVDLYDITSGFQTGVVFLGEFVPYTKVDGTR